MNDPAKNRTVYIGDNLDVMRGLNRCIADAIITDPPFNSNRRYEHAFGTPSADKKGRKKPGFDDAWTMDDVRAEEHELLKKQEPDVYHLCALARKMHSPGMQAYLIMMATRILQCRELLKESGSMFLHCDPTANAYLRMLMDAVFKAKNRRKDLRENWRSAFILLLRSQRGEPRCKINLRRCYECGRDDKREDREKTGSH